MRILLALCALTIAAHAAEFRTNDFLEALAAKETGVRWNGEPGPCGELSRWQIMPVVWAQHMRGVRFERARDEVQARVCATRHVEWLRARIIAAGVDPTPERIATCWHYGSSHRRRASVWGQEVSNLYQSRTQ